MAKLDPVPQAVLKAAYQRVGHELLEQAERAVVAAAWARRTWPRRRYPQQCYQKTLTYVRAHADIAGMRLVHGVISHSRPLPPLDHAWVELPGDIVFDAVVQAFFTRDSYCRVMSAVALDSYTPCESEQLLSKHGHPGPWTMRWVPTPPQLQAYYAAIQHVALEHGSIRSHGVPHALARAGVRAGHERSRQ
jgi:hypothetical protein